MRIFIIILLFFSIRLSAQTESETAASPLVFFGASKILIAESQKSKLHPTDLIIDGTSEAKSLLFEGKKYYGLSNTSILKFNSKYIAQTVAPNTVNSKVVSAELPSQKPKIDKPQNKGINFALFIANADYQFNTAGLGDLSKPIIDAENLESVLVSDYQFSQENIIFLKNADRSKTLNTLEQIAKNMSSNDNLLIFYAGHGYWDEFLKVGYWLPTDANFNNKSTWIANSTIKNYINAIPSKHTLLITDACFSGSIMNTRSVNAVNAYAVSKLYKLPSRKAMTSGTLTVVPDESVFLKYLIQRLEENEDDYLPASQLFFNMRSAILNNSSTVPQFGTIQNTGDEGGDFIFMKK